MPEQDRLERVGHQVNAGNDSAVGSGSQMGFTDEFSFVHRPAGWYGEAHPAPRRLLWVLLDGHLEVETSDAEVLRFTKGDVLLADDTTGKGHVSRITGREDLRAVTVALRA